MPAARERTTAEAEAVAGPDTSEPPLSTSTVVDPSASIPPTADVSTDGTAPPRPDPVGPAGVPTGREPAVVATVGWAELGLSGPADLRARTQVLIEQAGAWVPVESPAIAGVSISRVSSAGQDLILEGWLTDDAVSGSSTTRTFASGDGRTWRLITTLSDDSRLVGVGTAWVDLPSGSGAGNPTIIRSSGDSGATWQTLDLATVDDRLAGSSITSASSGPLGLGFVAAQYGDGPATTYLVMTRDLINFTVTSVPDLIGRSGASATVHVGSDRVLVSATGHDVGQPSTAATVTLIGTPER